MRADRSYNEGVSRVKYQQLESKRLVGCLVGSVTLSRSTSVIGKARERRTSRC